RATLVLASGSTTSAQQQLEIAWKSAASAVAPLVGPDELLDVERVVRGEMPLPLHVIDHHTSDCNAAAQSHDLLDATAFGRAVNSFGRPSFDLAPVMVTWAVCVFLVCNTDRSRRAFACIPRESL